MSQMVNLREFKVDDIDRLVVLANNRNVSKYLTDIFPYPYTKEDAIWWLETGAKNNAGLHYAIDYQNEFVGAIGITPQSGWKNHSAEIGYWLGEPYWGKGIATIALTEMTEYSFSVLGFKKLFAPVFEQNKASMRVLEKCDYRREGILEYDVLKDGEYHHLHYFAKTSF